MQDTGPLISSALLYTSILPSRFYDILIFPCTHALFALLLIHGRYLMPRTPQEKDERPSTGSPNRTALRCSSGFITWCWFLLLAVYSSRDKRVLITAAPPLGFAVGWHCYAALCSLWLMRLWLPFALLWHWHWLFFPHRFSLSSPSVKTLMLSQKTLWCVSAATF